MVFVKLANRLIDRLVPKVEAHACQWAKIPCGCVGGFQKYVYCNSCGLSGWICGGCSVSTTRC